MFTDNGLELRIGKKLVSIEDSQQSEINVFIVHICTDYSIYGVTTARFS